MTVWGVFCANEDTVVVALKDGILLGHVFFDVLGTEEVPEDLAHFVDKQQKPTLIMIPDHTDKDRRDIAMYLLGVFQCCGFYATTISPHPIIESYLLDPKSNTFNDDVIGIFNQICPEIASQICYEKQKTLKFAKATLLALQSSFNNGSD